MPISLLARPRLASIGTIAFALSLFAADVQALGLTDGAFGTASRHGEANLEGEAERPIEFAQGGCSAAAAQAAQQSGGQVLSVQAAQQGGRTVCIVTVLIPGRDGSRPRRQTITVPQ